jgi:hypothetical protein
MFVSVYVLGVNFPGFFAIIREKNEGKRLGISYESMSLIVWESTNINEARAR